MQPKINKTTIKPLALKHWFSTVGVISCGLLVLLILGLLLPVVEKRSSALSSNPPAWIPSNYVTLSLDTMPAIDLVPREGGGVGVSQAKLRVSTTSNTGYKLYINTLDDTNAMVSTSINQPATIQPLASPTTLNNFKPNTWGYAITNTLDGSSNATYSPMPTTTTVAYDTTTISGEHYLSFAASIDASLPAGQYSNTVAISAIANPAVVTGMMELSYMQDMTSSICKDTIGWDQNYNRDANGSYIITPGNEVSKQLIDIRDGKEYWVSKLADGNCWMVQNLAYDLVKGKVLTSSDSDVTGNWTVPNTTRTKIPSPTTNPPVNSTDSFNIGNYVLAVPASSSLCLSPSDKNGHNSVMIGETLDQCPEFQNVEAEWSPTFNAQPGIWNNQEVAWVATNIKNKTYDSHYLIGNYYQYSTITADSGTNLTSTIGQDINGLKDAPDSICPKGWKLPTSGLNTVTLLPFNRADSFYQLLLAYGYNDYIPDKENNQSYASILYGTLNNAHQDFTQNPIYIVQSGGVHIINGSLNNAGLNAALLASTAYSDKDNSYNFVSAPPKVNASGFHVRHYAFPARCLAR